MLSALKYYAQFKSQKKLSSAPIFIGPNEEIVDTCLRAIEKAQNCQVERLQAKDSDDFCLQLISRQSQRSFFKDEPLYFIESCSPKFIEKSLLYAEKLKTNIIFYSPKFPYKSPLIPRLEAAKFIVLTCFDPSAQDLHFFAENYLQTKNPKLKEIMAHLPPSLSLLLPELDKITLTGLDAYKCDESEQDKTLDQVCFDYLRGHIKAPHELRQMLNAEQLEPTAFLKILLYQIRKFRDYAKAEPAKRNTLRLSKIAQMRYEKLMQIWTLPALETKIAAFYNIENLMRHQHELDALMLEQALFQLFIQK